MRGKYLKNVVYKYLTSEDAGVKGNLVKVIIQALKFDEEESA